MPLGSLAHQGKLRAAPSPWAQARLQRALTRDAADLSLTGALGNTGSVQLLHLPCPTTQPLGQEQPRRRTGAAPSAVSAPAIPEQQKGVLQPRGPLSRLPTKAPHWPVCPSQRDGGHRPWWGQNTADAGATAGACRDRSHPWPRPIMRMEQTNGFGCSPTPQPGCSPGNLAAKSKVTAAPAGAPSDLLLPPAPGSHAPSPLPYSFFQDPLISHFLQEAFQVPLGQSACPASDLPEREQPQWGLPAWPPSLAAEELLGLPVGPLCPGPSWTWCSGTCVQRETLWAMPAFREMRLNTNVAADPQPWASASAGKPAPP